MSARKILGYVALFAVSVVFFMLLVVVLADHQQAADAARAEREAAEAEQFKDCKRTGYTTFSEIWTCPDGNVYKR